MADLNVALILRLVDKATAPARAALKKIESAGAGMRQYGASQLALSRTQIAAAQDRTRALGAEALALAGTGYAMVRALQPAISFEAAMAKVGAVSRASGTDLDRLTETARQLGRETPWSASQAADGMQYLAMAGFDVNEVIAAMPGMLDLASAGAIDLGSAADIASNILTGFNLDAAETGRLGDVLVNTFTSSNTTLGSLGETMKYVAPTAAALGVDLETAAAMAGKLGDAGIQGSEAGTALRAVLARLAAPSKAAADVLAELGVATADANGNLRGVPDILADIDEAMKGYGGAARAEMVKTLFETEAMSAATVLLGQAGSGALQDYAAALRETGSAARVAKQINDNTAGAIKTLQSRLEALSITMGSVVVPLLVDLLDRIVPVIDRIGEWAEANPELVRTIAVVAAGLFALRVALLAGRLAVQTAIMAFYAFNGLLAAVTWVAGAALSTIGVLGRGILLLGRIAGGAILFGLRVLGGAIRLVGQALLIAGRAALANPLLLALTLIAGAAYVIYDNWDGIVSYFQDKIERVRAAFDDGLLNDVLKLLAEFNPFTLIIEAAEGLFTYLTGWSFEDVTASLRAAFDINLYDQGVALIRSLWDGMISLIDQMVAWAKNKISGLIPEMPSWLGGGSEAPAPAGADTTGGASGSWEPEGDRALGGPVRAGQIYRWMEEGEEYFSPRVDG